MKTIAYKKTYQKLVTILAITSFAFFSETSFCMKRKRSENTDYSKKENKHKREVVTIKKA